jgi:hypothetical protein
MTKRAPLTWKQEGESFALYSHRRRFGRVYRDSKYPSMWRSTLPDGTPSDMAGLAWAKNAVLVMAERELAFEVRPPMVAARTPTLLGKTGVFSKPQPRPCDILGYPRGTTGLTISSSVATSS